MTKHEILKQAFDSREQEILHYQINIDNYTLAIKHIKESGDTDLIDFCKSLENILITEIREQKKAKVMHLVIQQQLHELDNG